MATYFDVTAPVTTIAIDGNRQGEIAFTVSNATGRTIRGEAIAVPGPGADAGWCTVDRSTRTYAPNQAEQISVTVAIPKGAPPGPASFRLRVQLGGGVPEEDFDDSPEIRFDVPPTPVD
jgi:hypothetical protein